MTQNLTNNQKDQETKQENMTVVKAFYDHFLIRRPYQLPLQHCAATTSFSGKRTHRMKLVDLSIWIEKQDGFALWCSLMNTGGGVVRKHF